MNAFEIVFDYSYDSKGFFDAPARRACLEKVARYFEHRIDKKLDAITPSGQNSWTLHIKDPSTGKDMQFLNPVLEANKIIIVVGAQTNLFRSDGTDAAGLATENSFDQSGSYEWYLEFVNRIKATNYSSIGASISFSLKFDWYFDDEPETIESHTGLDFFSIAIHEVVGIGTSISFHDNVLNGYFTGSNAVRLYGGPVPLSDRRDHFRAATIYKNNPFVMQPFLPADARLFNEVEFCVLQDLGYSVKPPQDAKVLPLGRKDSTISMTWQDGLGPFIVQGSSNLSNWVDLSSGQRNRMYSMLSSNAVGFYRILDLGR